MRCAFRVATTTTKVLTATLDTSTANHHDQTVFMGSCPSSSLSGGEQVTSREIGRTCGCLEQRCHSARRGDIRSRHFIEKGMVCGIAAHSNGQEDEVFALQVCSIVSHVRYNLKLCREFDPSFHAVSKAWKSVPKAERDKHFFASLDFADGEKIFRRVRICSTNYDAT